MALVDYSDSDDSDAGVSPALKSVRPSKGTFQKVVDRANTGKIRISLPQPVLHNLENEDEHPAKRVKTGGGGLSDFKSYLPPPKRKVQASGVLHGSTDIPLKTSITSRFLETGATPEFSRGSDTSLDSQMSHPGNLRAEIEMEKNGGVQYLASTEDLDENSQKLRNEMQGIGKPLMFKPLSVAKSSGKKKKNSNDPSTASSSLSGTHSVLATTPNAELSAPYSKMSLFPMSSETSSSTSSNGLVEYQPMIYGKHTGEKQYAELSTMDADLMHIERIHSSQATRPADLAHPSGARSLHDIASDLNLTAADRRQLFGRQKGRRVQQATKVINFNTDEEYRKNEELRAAGEQVVHNPVRAIAPGKHSLKQLVNAAASQKEALEESFVIGKNNRAEASSRYGW